MTKKVNDSNDKIYSKSFMRMWFKHILILFIVFISISDFAFAQQNTVKTDSTFFYGNSNPYSKQTKFTKFMYRIFYKKISPDTKKKTRYKKLIQKPYNAFEGKIIRHINIETLDPFKHSITDTTVAPQNFILRTANKIHVKSHAITIRNLLLIRQNQPFDSLLVKESERLVRSQKYIRDVSFFVKSTSKNSDSVDVLIRALDIWTIIPKVSTSLSQTTIGLTDNNFLGLGHKFQNVYKRNYIDEENFLSANYLIPNFRNTYISTTLNYGFEGHKFSNKSLSIDRPFFSPFAKWAAGVNFTQQFGNDSIFTNNSYSELRRYKFNSQDYWGGFSTRIFKGNTENRRTTNFISSLRFLRIHYLEKPNEIFDTQHFFSNENFYLSSMSISTRKYVQDKFIFKYGITEDVPIGKVFGLTGGYQVKNNDGRFYFGGRISFYNYFQWGYLSSNFEYGTFFRASHAEYGVLTAGANYFTGIIEIGKWKFRQFIKPQIIIGINHYSSDSLTLNDGFGLDGFKSPILSGTSRLLLKMQTQSYAPWNFIGFRFGPYLIFSLGMLGDAETGFKNSKLYSQIGIGVLIKNESLLLNTFQLSISFYPTIPGIGQNIFKMNSLKTTDFGFSDFEIGKPSITEFR